MSNGSTIPNVEPGIPATNAVSVYGQSDAMDDFPVLKAFQQYVDAEQAKAQKRMTTLCVFFGLILTMVVGVFVAIILAMSNAKNDVGEKLLQYLFQERTQQVQVQPQANPQNDMAFKALTDTVTALQKQLADQQLKMLEEKQKAAEEAVKRAAEAAAAQVKAKQPEPPSQDQLDLEKKNKEETEKLAKAAAALQKQKDDLAKEKEALRQKEIELQRRRLYPEYYQKLEAAKNQPAAPQVDEDDDDDADIKADLEALRKGATSKPLPPVATPAAKPQKSLPKPMTQEDGSVRYFDEEDDSEETAEDAPVRKPQPKAVPLPQAPAAAAHDTLLSGKGAASGWTLPLE